MSRFQATFDRCRSEGRTALMPYMTAGDPSLEWTERLIDEVAASGADMIELGVPYSDPIADGPTVQAAGQRALEAGTTLRGVFDLVQRVRRRHDLPVALLVYYNCIFRSGEEAFVRRAQESGVDGLIVPDLPPEEGKALQRVAEAHGIDLVYLVAPTSTEARLRTVVQCGRGFLYCVSLVGVTGARKEVSGRLFDFLAKVRAVCRDEGKELPLAVGFGISTPQHVAEIAPHADGVIVGSALIDRLHSQETLEAGVAACGELMRKMLQATGKQGNRKERSA